MSASLAIMIQYFTDKVAMIKVWQTSNATIANNFLSSICRIITTISVLFHMIQARNVFANFPYQTHHEEVVCNIITCHTTEATWMSRNQLILARIYSYLIIIVFYVGGGIALINEIKKDINLWNSGDENDVSLKDLVDTALEAKDLTSMKVKNNANKNDRKDIEAAETRTKETFDELKESKQASAYVPVVWHPKLVWPLVAADMAHVAPSLLPLMDSDGGLGKTVIVCPDVPNLTEAEKEHFEMEHFQGLGIKKDNERRGKVLSQVLSCECEHEFEGRRSGV